MNNIANERKKLGITQSELAGSCGWNQSRLANYEAGIRAPDLDS
ncbi:helix-turn-helix domain-containing protein, partial [Enterobacter hormaechei]